MASPRVLVIDNGSLSISALCRRIEEIGAATDVVGHAEVPKRLGKRHQALVLSGTKIPAMHIRRYQRVVGLLTESGVPVLGVCGGMHIIGVAYGGTLVLGKQRVGGHQVQLDVQEPLFSKVAPIVSLFQRHTLYLQRPPIGFKTIAWSEECPIEFIRSDDGRLIGSQAHLEFRKDGLSILRGYLDLVGHFMSLSGTGKK